MYCTSTIETCNGFKKILNTKLMLAPNKIEPVIESDDDFNKQKEYYSKYVDKCIIEYDKKNNSPAPSIGNYIYSNNLPKFDLSLTFDNFDNFNSFVSYYFAGRCFSKQRKDKAFKLFNNKSLFEAFNELSAEDPAFIDRPWRRPGNLMLLGASAPLKQTLLYKANAIIQQAIYNLPFQLRVKIKQHFEASSYSLTSEQGRNYLFKELGITENIKNCYIQAAELNVFCNNAFSHYDGKISAEKTRIADVNKKIKLHNKYAQANGNILKDILPELDENNPVSILNSDGTLKNKPGINYSFNLNAKGIHVADLNNEDHKEIIDKHLPGFTRDLSKNISKYKPKLRDNRSNSAQKLSSKKSETKNINDSIPLIIFYNYLNGSSDYFILDARGLLHLVNRLRKNCKYTTNIYYTNAKSLLDLFTGDPTFYPTKNRAQICLKDVYKASGEQIDSTPVKEILNIFSSAAKIKYAVKTYGSAYVLGIDLGVTHPAALCLLKITPKTFDSIFTSPLFKGLENYSIEKVSVDFSNTCDLNKYSFLPSDILRQIITVSGKIQTISDEIGKKITAQLTPGQRVEKDEVEKNPDLKCLAKLYAAGLLPKGSDSEYPFEFYKGSKNIANYISSLNNPELLAIVTSTDKNGKEYLLNDKAIIRMYTPGLSQETAEIYQNIRRQIQRTDLAYKKLSQQREELAKQVCNLFIKALPNMADLRNQLFIAVEDLETNEGFFDGRTTHKTGWAGIWIKNERKDWFIKHLLTSIKELACDKGLNIVVINKNYTSQHCTMCGHISAENRNGDIFNCKKCNHKANSDSDIAAVNIAMIAVMGNNPFITDGKIASKAAKKAKLDAARKVIRERSSEAQLSKPKAVRKSSKSLKDAMWQTATLEPPIHPDSVRND